MAGERAMGPLCWPEGILGVLSWHTGKGPGGHPGQRGPQVRVSTRAVTVPSSQGRAYRKAFRWEGDS